MTDLGTLPPQRRRELGAAEERRRAEARAAADRARPHPDAIAARRPGLDSPGERQLRHPRWLKAALAGVHTPEDAKAALAALTDAEGVS